MLGSKIYTENNNCPRTEPCGQPKSTESSRNLTPPTIPLCVLWHKNWLIHLWIFPLMLQWHSFHSSLWCDKQVGDEMGSLSDKGSNWLCVLEKKIISKDIVFLHLESINITCVSKLYIKQSAILVFVLNLVFLEKQGQKICKYHNDMDYRLWCKKKSYNNQENFMAWYKIDGTQENVMKNTMHYQLFGFHIILLAKMPIFIKIFNCREQQCYQTFQQNMQAVNFYEYNWDMALLRDLDTQIEKWTKLHHYGAWHRQFRNGKI